MNKPEAMVFADNGMTTVLVAKWDAKELREGKANLSCFERFFLFRTVSDRQIV